MEYCIGASLLPTLADLAHGIVGGQTSFEGRGGLKKDPGKCGANKSEKAKAGKNPESAPAQTGEEVSARPNPSL